MAETQAKRGNQVAIGIIAVIALAALASQCDAPDAAPDSKFPVLAGPVPVDAQQARLNACMNRLAHYRDLGVVKAGGAQPMIDENAWKALDTGEQAEIYQIAACIDSEGQVQEKIVTLKDAKYTFSDIGTQREANNRDFAKEFPSAPAASPSAE